MLCKKSNSKEKNMRVYGTRIAAGLSCVWLFCSVALCWSGDVYYGLPVPDIIGENYVESWW